MSASGRQESDRRKTVIWRLSGVKRTLRPGFSISKIDRQLSSNHRTVNSPEIHHRYRQLPAQKRPLATQKNPTKRVPHDGFWELLTPLYVAPNPAGPRPNQGKAASPNLTRASCRHLIRTLYLSRSESLSNTWSRLIESLPDNP